MSCDQREMHNKMITMNKSMINLKQMYNQILGAKKVESELTILKKKY